MRFEYKPAFLRQYRHLPLVEQEQSSGAIQKLIHFFEKGEKPQGLGLKQLRKPFWEIRATIHLRILFRFQGDLVEFTLVGNHDEIRRFLKNC